MFQLPYNLGCQSNCAGMCDLKWCSLFVFNKDMGGCPVDVLHALSPGVAGCVIYQDSSCFAWPGSLCK